MVNVKRTMAMPLRISVIFSFTFDYIFDREILGNAKIDTLILKDLTGFIKLSNYRKFGSPFTQ